MLSLIENRDVPGVTDNRWSKMFTLTFGSMSIKNRLLKKIYQFKIFTNKKSFIDHLSRGSQSDKR